MRFAAKAAFELKTTYRNRQNARVFYEVRTMHVEARTADSALQKMKHLCEQDQWAVSPDPDIKLQSQKFLGLIEFEDITFLDEHEVWYEFVDEKPTVMRSGGKAVPTEFRGSARKVPGKRG